MSTGRPLILSLCPGVDLLGRALAEAILRSYREVQHEHIR